MSPRRTLLALFLLVSCRSHESAHGEWLLDPVRIARLQPDAIVARIAPKPTDIVADVGAGPGAFVPAWSRALTQGALIATDIRADYLVQIPTSARVQTRLVTATTTGLDDDSVDVVFLCQVDHFFADRHGMLAKLSRALKPGGRVVVVNATHDLPPLERVTTTLHWRVLDTWTPAPGMFAQVYAADTLR